MRSKGLSLAKIGAKYGFSKQKVDYILKNKNYIGIFEYNGKKEKNDIIVTSKWHGYNHENTTNEERIFTFTFKRNSDKEYYLYSADSQTTTE